MPVWKNVTATSSDCEVGGPRRSRQTSAIRPGMAAVRGRRAPEQPNASSGTGSERVGWRADESADPGRGAILIDRSRHEAVTRGRWQIGLRRLADGGISTPWTHRPPATPDSRTAGCRQDERPRSARRDSHQCKARVSDSTHDSWLVFVGRRPSGRRALKGGTGCAGRGG